MNSTQTHDAKNKLQRPLTASAAGPTCFNCRGQCAAPHHHRVEMVSAKPLPKGALDFNASLFERVDIRRRKSKSKCRVLYACLSHVFYGGLWYVCPGTKLKKKSLCENQPNPNEKTPHVEVWLNHEECSCC